MRRSSNKKTGPSSNSSSSSSPIDLFRSSSSKAVAKELERIDQLFFNSYANGDSGMIEPDGIEVLCSDLGVDYTDIKILMLAWKMKAEKQGYFTLEEWRRGLKALRADTISKLKKALPELEKEVRRPQVFLDFYSFSFQYCLTEEKQKSIDIESICELLELVLGSQFRPQVDSLIEYLKVQNDYKVINMDQWLSFLRFCLEVGNLRPYIHPFFSAYIKHLHFVHRFKISFPDLGNYDADQAWPLILDYFVEWMRAKQS